MLKRVVTALLLMGTGVGLYYMPINFFYLVMLAIMIGILFEAARLTKVSVDKVARYLFLFMVVVPAMVLPILCRYALIRASRTVAIFLEKILTFDFCMVLPYRFFLLLMILGVFIWILIAIRLLIYQQKPDTALGLGFGTVILQLLFVGISLPYMVYLPETAVYFLAMVCCYDIGALLVGKLCGLHSLASRISPNKTWEGAIGGALVAMLATALVGRYYYHSSQWLWLMILALPVSGFAVLGDLFESALKREAGVKDSGTLLPGHGGIYDRVDSWLAAMPIYMLGISFILDGRVNALYDFFASWESHVIHLAA